MADKTITSANSVFTLSVGGIFTAPQRIQGYSTDAAFAIQAVTPAEVQMGVDGLMSAGYTPMPSVQTITLQADSKSNDLFETWFDYMRSNREVYWATGVLILPSVKKKYNLNKGALTSYTPLAESRKVLQPRPFQITWEVVAPSII